MKKHLVLTMSCLIAALQAGSVLAAENPHWSYSGHDGPKHWSTLDPEFKVCATGKNQSPIDVTAAVAGALAPLVISYQPSGASVINDGHTVQVNYQTGSYITLDGEPFELKQFHFHTPSENLIRGESFPLEGHFVHADKNGSLAVIAVMFKEGNANHALASIWPHIPAQVGATAALKQPVDASQLLPAQQDYYRFSGSLTTPPCSEGVRWLVMKAPQSLSASQITELMKIMKHSNNRPVQPLNGRVVVAS
ncbi:carbonic anhydrase family protein [Photobacterium sp. 2_MG-2023]|uniref:carbonic anhydrase n=1 Tax=Photobacterium sp. 2_MG-2023 TaxID=3062663 RepID=UPI0026E1AB7C|nr:carbonic anhydrase family protein [Photobacterium sp. 2_MG-2023]MDO6581578.1 carbonic anhydrase family protein [Photobacterium sp. 2_MG-2023]